MDSKVNYTAVGFFVVVLLLATFSIVLWLTSSMSAKHYKTYLALFGESVSGLALKAPVKYNGVNVGFVDKVKLDPRNPKNVILFLNIESDVVIHEDATATINSSGLTGIAYVELRGGSPTSALLTRKPGHRYAVLKTQPSLLVRMDITVRKLSDDLNKISASINNLLSEQNTEAFSHILSNLDKTTAVLADNTRHIDNMIQNTDVLIARLTKLSKRFPSLINHADTSIVAVGNMSQEVRAASREVRMTMSQSRRALNTVTDQMLPVTTTTLENVSSLATEMQKLSSDLQQNPSMVIRGRAPVPLGPGEK